MGVLELGGNDSVKRNYRLSLSPGIDGAKFRSTKRLDYEPEISVTHRNPGTANNLIALEKIF